MYDMIPGTLTNDLPYDTCHLLLAKRSRTRAQRQVASLLARRASSAAAIEGSIDTDTALRPADSGLYSMSNMDSGSPAHM